MYVRYPLLPPDSDTMGTENHTCQAAVILKPSFYISTTAAGPGEGKKYVVLMFASRKLCMLYISTYATGYLLTEV